MDKVLFQSDLQPQSVGVFEDFYFKVSLIKHDIEYCKNIRTGSANSGHVILPVHQILLPQRLLVVIP